MATSIDQFPHCDQRILHGPEDGCEYCNLHPEWQALREAWGIAFTGHQPEGQWVTLPCPADAARPPGSAGDHRRWGGNKPTSAAGDQAWPAETAASVMMYGDKGGREPWPLRERIRMRLRRPLENRRLRRAWFRRENGWWRYP